MVNRNDVTSPTDTVNKLAQKRHSHDDKALYGDDLASDANAKAAKNTIPEPSKTPSAPSELDDKSGRRIGKDPTESF